MVGKAPSRMAAGVPGELGPMIVVVGPQRTDHGDVIGTCSDVPPPVGDQQPTLPITLITGVESHEHTTIAVGRVSFDDVLAFASHDVAVRSVADGPAGEAVQFRLHVKALDVADAAAQEDPDDRLGLRREVRPASGGRIDRRGPGDAVAEKHGAQGQAGKTHAGIGEEGAARDAGAEFRFSGHGSLLAMDACCSRTIFGLHSLSSIVQR